MQSDGSKRASLHSSNAEAAELKKGIKSWYL